MHSIQRTPLPSLKLLLNLRVLKYFRTPTLRQEIPNRQSSKRSLAILTKSRIPRTTPREAFHEHHRLAELVGTPTMGTNGNMVYAKLPCGFTMSFTAMKVLKQDGTPHHGIGIRPTVSASPTRKGLAEGSDEVIEKSLEILLKKQPPADSRSTEGKKN